MSANNKLTPINGMKNKVTKTNDNNESTSEVAIKVATILDRNTAQQQHSQSGGNGQNSQMEAGRKQTNRRVVQFGATNVQNTNQVIPWWKSSIIKLIGSFLVGIACLSIVFAAVMIRNDSPRHTFIETLSNPVTKRSASSRAPLTESKSLPIDNANVDKVGQQMLSSEVNALQSSTAFEVPVPIKVVIDPQLISPIEQSSNLELKQSNPKVDIIDPRHLTNAIKATKATLSNENDNRYIIEMDIKVKNSM